MADQYVALMHFIDGSHSFVMGFECGKIWETMNQKGSFEGQPVHSCNREQIALMAKHHGYDYDFSTMDEQWMTFSASPVDISDLKLNR